MAMNFARQHAGCDNHRSKMLIKQVFPYILWQLPPSLYSNTSTPSIPISAPSSTYTTHSLNHQSLSPLGNHQAVYHCTCGLGNKLDLTLLSIHSFRAFMEYLFPFRSGNSSQVNHLLAEASFRQAWLTGQNKHQTTLSSGWRYQKCGGGGGWRSPQPWIHLVNRMQNN